jgi:hypothetical protein
MQLPQMNPLILVVARSSSALNKFEQRSLQSAFNIKDFLEETGEYDEVSIFQLRSSQGPLREWVKLDELEC